MYYLCYKEKAAHVMYAFICDAYCITICSIFEVEHYEHKEAYVLISYVLYFRFREYPGQLNRFKTIEERFRATTA